MYKMLFFYKIGQTLRDSGNNVHKKDMLILLAFWVIFPNFLGKNWSILIKVLGKSKEWLKIIKIWENLDLLC